MSTSLSPFYQTGNLVFISGQVGSDPDTQIIPEDFEMQLRLTFQNLKRVLVSAGLVEHHIVKTTVYMTDLSHFDRMNELYGEFFQDHKPARTTLGVSALPQFPGDPHVYIEIDAIAEKP